MRAGCDSPGLVDCYLDWLRFRLRFFGRNQHIPCASPILKCTAGIPDWDCWKTLFWFVGGRRLRNDWPGQNRHAVARIDGRAHAILRIDWRPSGSPVTEIDR